MQLTKQCCVSVLGAVLMLGGHAAIVQGKNSTSRPPTQSVPAPRKDPRAPLKMITITGTLIRAPNVTSESPIMQLSAAQIQDMGTTDIGLAVNQLPQVSVAQNDHMANNVTGVANISLRGLGPTRTLVLVDGRRLGPGDPQSPDGEAADVNFIPAAIVKSIDVLTGGASAVYGSDAIAGVVNFHLISNFTGVKVFETLNAAQHTQGGPSDAVLQTAPFLVKPKIPGNQFGGLISDTTVIMGTSLDGGKGNVTMYVEYRTVNPIYDASRNFEACETTLNGAGTGNVCHGSAMGPYGNFTPNDGSGPYALNPNGSRTFVPFTKAFRYNTTPVYDLQRPDSRSSLGAIGHYRLSQWAEVYGRAMFMDDITRAQTAASGLFAGAGPTGFIQIPCNNPFLSNAEEPYICQDAAGNPLPRYQANGQPNVATIVMPGFRMANWPRIDNLRHEDYYGVLGLRGAIGRSDWIYDVSGSYWNSQLKEHFQNDIDYTKVENALFGCVAPNTSPGCVPLDIFRYNGVTQAMFNYIQTPGLKEGSTTESNLQALVNGDFGAWGGKSPWATNPIAAAFGVSFRRDTLNFLPDYLLQNNLLIGQQAFIPPVSGSERTTEEYAEIRVPVIDHKPYVKAFDLDIAGRHSGYSVGGHAGFSTNTYKLALNYSPDSDIRFRASYNRAVRAPNIYELFFPQTIGSDTGYDDPCSGATPTASLAACERTGVTPAEYGHIRGCPTLNCSLLGGGNPALRPESADTFTYGFVFTPTFVPNLQMSLDYWSITINNYITTLPGAQIVDGCLLKDVTSLCGLIHRGIGGVISGSTGWVVETDTNIGYLRNRGIDFDLNYREDLSNLGLHHLGSLLFNMTGTYLLEQTTSAATTYNCAGLYGSTCSAGEDTSLNFRWRHTARLTWLTPWKFNFSLRWRYFSSVGLDTNSSQPALNNGFFDAYDNVIPAYNYLDMAVSWHPWKNVTLRAGCNNVMDKDPPFLNDTVIYGVVGGADQNVYTAYDVLGRELFLTGSIKL